MEKVPLIQFCQNDSAKKKQKMHRHCTIIADYISFFASVDNADAVAVAVDVDIIGELLLISSSVTVSV